MLSPTLRLLLAIGVSVISALAAVTLALAQPWHGLVFERGVNGATPVLMAGPAPLARGDTVLTLATSATHTAIALRSDDLVEDLDYLVSFSEEKHFLARQDSLHRVLQGTVTATVRSTSGTSVSVALPRLTRPLSSLPQLFWFQLILGVFGLLTGAWVWTLRPDEPGPRLYAATGVALLIATHAAAVYSTRSIALPASTFLTLSHFNHLGALLFGGCLVALALTYPVAIIRFPWTIVVPAILISWWALGTLRVFPTKELTTPIPLALSLCGTLSGLVLQWRRTRGDPAGRTIVRWMVVSVLLSCGASVITSNFWYAFTGSTLVPQGYSFGFVLPMYVGVAVGLRQFRLFDLDEWAVRLLFWTLLVAAVVSLDVALVVGLRASGTVAVGVSALVAALSIPIRQWVWARLLRRRSVPPAVLLSHVSRLLDAPTAAARSLEWRQLLVTLFDPLHIAEAGSNSAIATSVELMAQGRELAVPGFGETRPLRLSYARGGRRLFRTNDAVLVQQLITLFHEHHSAVAAYDSGVSAERSRIARDLHDLVSGPLLADTMVSPNVPAVRQRIDSALEGMRAVVRGESAPGGTLFELLADLRYDSVQRLTRNGLVVDWPLPTADSRTISPIQRHAITAIVQECVTNVLRHAHATRVDISVEYTHDQRWWVWTCRDNGHGIPETLPTSGHGLSNLRERATLLEAELTIGARGDQHRGTQIVLRVPITTFGSAV